MHRMHRGLLTVHCLQAMNVLVMVIWTVGAMTTILNAVSGAIKQSHVQHWLVQLVFQLHMYSPFTYIAVKQVINVSGRVDDSGLLVTWKQQPGSGYNYEVCYTDLSTATQTCENVTDAGSHTFISATGTAVYQVTVKAFAGQTSAPATIPVQISELQYAL